MTRIACLGAMVCSLDRLSIIYLLTR
uniref:Uncharacterized protein n=1 Tax=Arundo donax TaxID=35708 RepID=A0A0A8Z1W6_ARUDO